MSNKKSDNQIFASFFNEILSGIEAEVEKLRGSALESETAVETLAKRFEVEALSLDKAATQVMIREESIRPGKAPENHKFEPGDKVEYASFRVPVKGKTNAVKTVLDTTNALQDGLDLKGSTLVFIHYAWDGPIERSEARQKKIRETAKAHFERIEQQLEVFNAEAEAFNKSLPEKIAPHIEKQRKRAAARKDSEAKLNPFG